MGTILINGKRFTYKGKSLSVGNRNFFVDGDAQTVSGDNTKKKD